MKDVEFKNVISFIRGLVKKLSIANGIDDALYERVIEEVIITSCVLPLQSIASKITRNNGDNVDIILEGFGVYEKDFSYTVDEAVTVVERMRAIERLLYDIRNMKHSAIASNVYTDKNMVYISFSREQTFLGSLILDARSMQNDKDGTLLDVVKFAKQRSDDSKNGMLRLASLFYKHYLVSVNKEFGEAEPARCAILGSAFLFADECLSDIEDQICDGIMSAESLLERDRVDVLREEIRSAIDDYIERRPDLDFFMSSYMMDSCCDDDCDFGDYDDDYDDDYGDEFSDDDE